MIAKRIPTFEEFILTESHEGFKEFFENDHKKTLFESISRSRFLTDDQRLVAEIIIENEQWNDLFEGTLNELSIISKFKEKAEKAKEVIKQKGKAALTATQETIMKLGGSISKLIGNIVKVIKGFFKSAWDIIQKKASELLDPKKEEAAAAGTKKFEEDPDLAKEEIGNLSKMFDGAKEWCIGTGDEMEGGLQQAAEVDESDKIKISSTYLIALESALFKAASILVEEDETFTRGILEGGGGDSVPYLSALAHKVAEFQPFKALHDIEKAVGKVVNMGLNKGSEFLTKYCDAPGVFKFVLVGSVFALVSGYLIKAAVENLVKEVGMTVAGSLIAMAIPGIGIVLSIMKYTAKGIWVVGVCETALGGVKGVAKAVKKSDDKPEKSEETENKEKGDEG